MTTPTPTGRGPGEDAADELWPLIEAYAGAVANAHVLAADMDIDADEYEVDGWNVRQTEERLRAALAARPDAGTVRVRAEDIEAASLIRLYHTVDEELAPGERGDALRAIKRLYAALAGEEG